MRPAAARSFLIVVVRPANDREPPPRGGRLFRIRWLRSRCIGRPEPAPLSVQAAPVPRDALSRAIGGEDASA